MSEPSTGQPEQRHRPPLFEIAQRLKAEWDAIDDAHGEVTEFGAAVLDALQLSLTERVEAYAAVRRMLLAEAEACDSQAAHYTKLSNQKRAKVDKLEQRVKDALAIAGVDRAVGATGGAALKQNPAHVELTVSEAAVPPEWFRVVPESRALDKKAIAAALKSGRKLEFAVLEKTVKLDWK